MLETIGVSSINKLFADVPAGVRFDRALDVSPALSEQELVAHLSELAAKNIHACSSAPASTTTTCRPWSTPCSLAASC